MIPDEFERDLADAAELIPRIGVCLDRERAIAIYQGRSSDAEAEAMRDHITTCRCCFELAQEARRFVAAMSDAAPPMRPASRAWRPRTALALLAAAAGLAAVFFLVPREWRATSREESAPSIEPAPYTPVPRAEGLAWRDESEDRFATAMASYQRGDFAAAELGLEAHLAQRPADDRARFYLAVCRLLLGRPKDAWPDLFRLARDCDPPLRDDARWYLVHAALGTGRDAAARRELEAIAAEADPHRDAARRWLEQLEGPRGSP